MPRCFVTTHCSLAHTCFCCCYNCSVKIKQQLEANCMLLIVFPASRQLLCNGAVASTLSTTCNMHVRWACLVESVDTAVQLSFDSWSGAPRYLPAQSNGQQGHFVQQIVVPQNLSCLAFLHDFVPELKIVGSEVLACLALEVILKPFLKAVVQNNSFLFLRNLSSGPNQVIKPDWALQL